MVEKHAVGHATLSKVGSVHTDLEVHQEREAQLIHLIQPRSEKTQGTRDGQAGVQCLLVSHGHGYMEVKQHVVQRTSSRA